MRRNSPFAVRARNAPKRKSHLVHMLEMVELARDTMASAHSPWGVHATAWVLGWASNTLLTPHRSRAQRSVLRTPIWPFVGGPQVSYGGVHILFSS